MNTEDENNIKGQDRTTTWKEPEHLEDFMEESSPTSLKLSTSRLLSVTFIFIVVTKLVLQLIRQSIFITNFIKKILILSLLRIVGHWLVPLSKESAVEYFVDLTYMTCFTLSSTISHYGPRRKKNCKYAVLEMSPSFSHIKKLRKLRTCFLRMDPIWMN